MRYYTGLVLPFLHAARKFSVSDEKTAELLAQWLAGKHASAFSSISHEKEKHEMTRTQLQNVLDRLNVRQNDVAQLRGEVTQHQEEITKQREALTNQQVQLQVVKLELKTEKKGREVLEDRVTHLGQQFQIMKAMFLKQQDSSAEGAEFAEHQARIATRHTEVPPTQDMNFWLPEPRIDDDDDSDIPPDDDMTKGK